MINPQGTFSLIVAYAFIFVTLAVYGITLYRRTRQVNATMNRTKEE